MADQISNTGPGDSVSHSSDIPAAAQNPVINTPDAAQPVTQPVTQTPQTTQATQPTTAPNQTTPEAYEFKLPEGMATDADTMKEAGDLFKSMNVSPMQAQQLLDFALKKQIIGGAVSAQEMFEEELNRKVSEWGDQTRAHPEFGGARLNESLADVRRAISKLGGEKLEAALSKETGIINHPEVWAAFVRMGRMLRESPFVSGSPTALGTNSTPQDRARSVYPNMR
jgi:uncharacterized membrane protein